MLFLGGCLYIVDYAKSDPKKIKKTLVMRPVHGDDSVDASADDINFFSGADSADASVCKLILSSPLLSCWLSETAAPMGRLEG